MKLVLAAVHLTVVLHCATAAPLAASKLEVCTSSDELQCEEKMVISIVVAPEANREEEYFVDLTTHVLDEDGVPVVLESPVIITLRRPRRTLRYPLVYKQSVNNWPREVVHARQRLFGDVCIDADRSDDVTCGWVMQEDDQTQRVPDSQGFCCVCSWYDVLHPGSDATRINSICTVNGENSASAHCLRFDSLWYSMFEVMRFDVKESVDVHVARQDGTLIESFRLSSDKPRWLSQTSGIAASFHGTLASTVGELSLESKYLLVPTVPALHERVLGGARNWMLVDRSMVSLDGRTCDRIGVGYTAFRHQVNACSRPAGSCLANQPQHLHAAAEALRSAGRRDSVFITSLADVDVGASRSLDLVIRSDSSASALVSIEVAASTVRFVRKVSPASIVSLDIASFAAMSRDGMLHVGVANTGFVQAGYVVSVWPCSVGVSVSPTTRFFVIAPFSRESFQFQVYVSAPEAARYQCDVVVYAHTGQVLDKTTTQFTTTPVEIDRGGQGGSDNDQGDAVLDPPPRLSQAERCAARCPGTLDLACMVWQACWQRLTILAVSLIVALALLALAVRVLRRLLCSIGAGTASPKVIRFASTSAAPNLLVEAPAPSPAATPTPASAPVATPPRAMSAPAALLSPIGFGDVDPCLLPLHPRRASAPAAGFAPEAVTVQQVVSDDVAVLSLHADAGAGAGGASATTTDDDNDDDDDDGGGGSDDAGDDGGDFCAVVRLGDATASPADHAGAADTIHSGATPTLFSTRSDKPLPALPVSIPNAEPT